MHELIEMLSVSGSVRYSNTSIISASNLKTAHINTCPNGTSRRETSPKFHSSWISRGLTLDPASTQIISKLKVKKLQRSSIPLTIWKICNYSIEPIPGI